MRIRNGATKAALTVVGYALALLVGITVESTTHSGFGVVSSSGLVLLLVLILTRLFRGENESDEPRQWWRMTARPTASYLLAGWFLLQVVGSASSALTTRPSVGWAVSAIVSLILASGYLISALRLGAMSRQQNAARI